MVWGVLAVVLIIIVVAASQSAGRKSAGSSKRIDPSAYLAVKPLTKTEQAFYRLLANSLPEHTILAQVDIKRLVRTKRGVSHQHFNRVAQLSLDYVICRQDFSVVAVVELDDPSHDKQRQRARDTKKDEVMRAVNVRLIRFDVRRYPSESQVRNSVLGTQSAESVMPDAA